ncbi:MAG: hypothetical protein P1U42_00435 [Phycisphaerales bacterium]|nr:hypothetical protein [Phycisphaerales bacterium]
MTNTQSFRPMFLSTIISVLLLCIACPTAHAQRQTRVDQFTQDTIDQTDALLASIVDEKTLKQAMDDVRRLSDYVSGHASARQFDAMVRAESVYQILTLIRVSKTADPVTAVELFVNAPSFMTELGLLVSEKDSPREVIRVATELMDNHPDQVEKYPALAAAICVVHDLPEGTRYSVRVNENSPSGASALEIFEFYVDNARSMFIKPDRLPAIDLVYVVDISEDIDQLEWAIKSYGTSPGIDQRFFEIVYDNEHFTQGKPKKVTTAGNYCLESIKKHGGVCADQAYFAMSVAKACGIPSGYVFARGADVSHAWVGYLEVRGRRAEWNFDAGRYPEYQKLRGNLLNPQTGEYISDGRVGILGEAARSTLNKVHHAMAAQKIVHRMNEGYWREVEQMELDTKGNERKARTSSVNDRLALLQKTLSSCAGVPRAWDMVTTIAKSGDMDEKNLDVWSRAALQLAGKTHQDFSFDFLSDLISTIDDADRQHKMWEWAFGQFRTRPDLAAAVRFEQGKLWDNNDNPEYAWIAYQDVLDKFLNEGPMSVLAIQSLGNLLIKNDKRSAYLKLLEDTARKVLRPQDMGTNFAKQSNFYQINRLLVLEMEHHNRDQDAKRLRDMIDMPASDR